MYMFRFMVIVYCSLSTDLTKSHSFLFVPAVIETMKSIRFYSFFNIESCYLTQTKRRGIYRALTNIACFLGI